MRAMLPDDDLSHDPIVRATVQRLRFSSMAVVVGVVVCIMLTGVMTVVAFRSGTNAALVAIESLEALPTDASAANLRSGLDLDGLSPFVYAVMAVGFLIIGVSIYLVVRRPYEAACFHARELVRAYAALEQGTFETIAALNATVEAKDPYTAGHGLRVTLISMLIGTELGLTTQEQDQLRHAATFHDIGKIAVPDAVLQHPGRLTDLEYEQIKLHPIESARICDKVGALRASVPAMLHHHERVDGTGYPQGLVGNAIPLAARIIAVADTWDAITSDRPYRLGQTPALALDEIRRVAGSQLDPVVVNAFVEVLAKDPWMFGLTPEQIRSFPAAPGEELAAYPRSAPREDLPPRDEQSPAIDWSSGLWDEPGVTELLRGPQPDDGDSDMPRAA